MKAYKLVRLLKNGEMSPLFINKKSRFVEGEKYLAEFHPTKGFAPRKGLHLCTVPVAPHLSMTLKSGETRMWVECEVEDYEMYDRPESQGGSWVLAQRMKIIRRLPEIKDTKGGYGG